MLFRVTIGKIHLFDPFYWMINGLKVDYGGVIYQYHISRSMSVFWERKAMRLYRVDRNCHVPVFSLQCDRLLDILMRYGLLYLHNYSLIANSRCKSSIILYNNELIITVKTKLSTCMLH